MVLESEPLLAGWHECPECEWLTDPVRRDRCPLCHGDGIIARTQHERYVQIMNSWHTANWIGGSKIEALRAEEV